MLEFETILGAVRAKARKPLIFLCLTTIISLMMIGCGGNATNNVPAGALSSSEKNIAFGTVTAGVESNKKTFTITNTAKVGVTGISYGLQKGQNEIFLVGSSCTATLASGAKCQVEVIVKPDDKNKTYSDVYEVKYTVESGQEEVLRINFSANTLNASGIEFGDFDLLIAGLDATSTSENYIATFDNTPFGTLSEVKTLTLTYNGQKSVIISLNKPILGGVISSEYRVVSDCISLNAGEKCSIFTTFTPTKEGLTNAQLDVSGVVESTKKDIPIMLTGTGTQPSEKDKLNTLVISDNITGDQVLAKIEATSIAEIKTKTLKLTNSGTEPYVLYRFDTTLPSLTLQYGTGANDCNGRLDTGKSCYLYATYGPSAVGKETGYVRVIRGSKSNFIKIEAEGTSAPTSSIGNVEVSVTALQFPETEQGFESEYRIVTLKNSSTSSSGNIRISILESGVPFTYNTTCVDNAPILKDSSCTVSVALTPSTQTTVGNKTATLRITNSASASTPADVALSGTVVKSVVSDNTTDIDNLIVSTKRINFPSTPLGYYSSSTVFSVKNIGSTPITGFVHTSTDLVRFFPDLELTTCRNTIAPDETCNIAYKFRATQAISFKEYIKLAADKGADRADISTATELIELSARGVLSNKNIFFGYVPDNTTKEITYSVVNETSARISIGTVKATGARWIWVAGERDNFTVPAGNTDSMYGRNNWLPECNSSATIGGCSGDKVKYDSYFRKDNLPDAKNPFELVQDACSNQNVDAGSSCIIKLRYDPKKDDNKTPLSVYVTIADRAGNTLDLLHGVASPTDNVSYFFPPEGDEKPAGLSSSGNFAYNGLLFSIGGNHYSNRTQHHGYMRDRFARKYDTARNRWTKYDNFEGADWVSVQMEGNDTHISPNETSHFYNGRLYIYLNGLLTTFNPAPVGNKVGRWETVPNSRIPIDRFLTNIASYNNIVYLYSGRAGVTTSTNANLRDMLSLDLNKNTGWTLVRRENLNTDNIDFPYALDLGTFEFVGNIGFLYAGYGFDSRFTNPDAPRFTPDSLWAFNAPKYNDDGSVANIEKQNKWELITGVSKRETSPEDPTIDNIRPYPIGAKILGIIGNRYLLVKSGGASTKYFTFDTTTTANPGTYNGWTKVDGIETRKYVPRAIDVVIDGVLWVRNFNVMGVQFSSQLEQLLK